MVKLFPFLRWFPMGAASLRADLIAGITVALVLIPQSMAYAQLAGLPPYYGLYAAFLPGILAALWGSSKQLATGPVAVVSLLTASALTPFAQAGTDQFVVLAILLAFMVGLIQLALGAFRLGVVVNFLSHPVIVGFTNAAALIIGLSQLNKIFGVPMPRSERLRHRHLGGDPGAGTYASADTRHRRRGLRDHVGDEEIHPAPPWRTGGRDAHDPGELGARTSPATGARWSGTSPRDCRPSPCRSWTPRWPWTCSPAPS